ncbi:condensation protein [Streptomyces roseolus]|nr:condensation protein [Streptomyces roseolus]
MRVRRVSESVSEGAGAGSVRPGRMNALDRAFAFLSDRGSEPFMVGHVLDFPAGSFTLDALRARVAERAPRLEPLHVAAVPGARSWTRTAPPRAGLHVSAERVDGRLAEATDAAQRRPLPARPAPRWDLRLLTCRTEKVQRVCFRVEHAITDGVGAAHLLAALLADEPCEGPHPYRPPVRRRRGSASWAATWPLGKLPDRETVPAGSGATRSGQVTVAYADVPEAELRAVASRWGVTVNDVHLAAVAGALAALQNQRTGRARDLRVVMPMSVRPRGASLAPGNAALPAIVRLPCTAATPRRRLEDLAGQTLAHKESGLRESGWRTLLRVPPRLLCRATERAGFRLAVSHINLNGAYRVFDAPLVGGGVFALNSPGMLGYFSLVRTTETARLTVVHDRSLVAAADLPKLWVEAVAELAGR